jgi:hypothetical protein
MNANGGYTKDGLLIWAVVERCYPQFHFGGEGYTFLKGNYKKFQHWLLNHEGIDYDPLFGTDHAPAGFVVAPRSRSASIDPAPQPTPAPAAPEPQPEPVAPVEQPAPQPEPSVRKYTVQSGDNLWKIVKEQYGLSDEHEIANKLEEVKRANPELERGHNFNLIHVGDVVTLP